MIGKWNIVEVVVDVIDVERRPATVAALQAFHPLDATLDGLVVTTGSFNPAGSIHCHDNHGSVVEVRIMRVGILEGPTPRSYMRTPGGPVSDGIKHLTR